MLRTGRLLFSAVGKSSGFRSPKAAPGCFRIGAQRWCSAKSNAGSDDEESLLLVTQEDGVRHIVLNHEKKRNALSQAMMEQLVFALEGDEKKNKDLSSVVISGRGRVFSAGHDLAELHKPFKVQPTELFQLCTYVMLAIRNLNVPVIAQVKGLATAAGCQLVASCDLVIAGENAKFATPGVNVGLFCHTPAVALCRAVPTKQAMHMLLTGQPITAQEALMHGLVSKVVPEKDLEAETKKVTDRLRGLSRDVLSYGKHIVYSQQNKTVEDAYTIASKAMVANAKFPNCQEGISAFLEKRAPKWKNES